MSDDLSFSLDDSNLNFENSPTRIVIFKNLQKVKVAGITIGPLKEKEEYETAYWIAAELVREGIARFHNESTMNLVTLNKIHWVETKIQTGRQIASLPKYFYPQVRKYIKNLKEKSKVNTSVVNEYNNVKRIFRDIVNCRLKKIVSLSASPTRTEILKSLSKEEIALFEYLRSSIFKWKSTILKVE
ncbi:MAG: DNA replication complex GINS family protein [Candidatus Bathyarchaeota archaeon]|nr:MAG: DNA replication complex GINS family protein [Candidatus Bathyarchaeota archaeon]